MHKLVITIYEVSEWNREALHIELDCPTNRIRFAYLPKPYESIEAEKTCKEEEIITKFNEYMNWLKW